MRYGLTSVSIRALFRPGWLATEMRVQINNQKADQYAEEMREGNKFPPPVVFVDPKTEHHWVGDGFHRITAMLKNGAKEVEVDLRRGRKEDAILFNIKENNKQRGLPFTKGDIRKSIETLARLPLTKEWPATYMAEQIGCSISYVTFILKACGATHSRQTIQTRNGQTRPATHNHRNHASVLERRYKIAKLKASGRTHAEIAEELGILKSTVASDVIIMAKERDLIRCPHCGGSGYISNLKGKK